MPSWNIHTAHVERLLAAYEPAAVGIDDVNAFLFGNYVPDVYLGFMVHDVGFRIDYCLTHLAGVSVIPLPDADKFWDDYVFRRRPKSPVGVSLTLGAWAHLLADRVYNERFRAFCETHEVPEGDELRILKQADYDLFGRGLGISSCVRETPELLEAARCFRPYCIMPADVAKAIETAGAIVRGDDGAPAGDGYRLLSAKWMNDVFDECDSLQARWLERWQKLERETGSQVSSEDIRAALG